MTTPTGHGEAARRARLAVAAAFLAQGLGFAAILTHLPAFKDQWALDDLGVTILMFAVAVLAGIGSVLAAVCAARWSSATALRIALVVAAVALTVVAFAGGFWVFCLGLGLYGIALGLIDATTNMQAVALEAEYGTSILTSFHAAWSVGGIVGALATSGAAALGWSVAAVLVPVSVLDLVVAAAPFRRRDEVRGAPEATQAVTGSTKQIPWRALGLLGLALVLFYVADSAASSWSSIYLSDVLLASATVAPLAYGAYQATSLASRAVGDRAVRRYGPTMVVRAAALIGMVGLATVIAAQAPWMAIVGFAVLGAGVAVVAPLTFAAAGRLAGPDPGRMRRIDALVARLNQFNYLGFVLGGVLTGLISSGSGLRWGFVVPLIGIALLLPLAGAFATGTTKVATAELSS
jgi:MFS family permease